MWDFNHGHIQWTSLQSTGREDQEFLNLVQGSFLSQHVIEPTRDKNERRNLLIMTRHVSHWDVVITTRYILSSKRTEQKNKVQEIFSQRKIYKDMEEYLAKIEWNDTLKNKTAT